MLGFYKDYSAKIHKEYKHPPPPEPYQASGICQLLCHHLQLHPVAISNNESNLNSDQHDDFQDFFYFLSQDKKMSTSILWKITSLEFNNERKIRRMSNSHQVYSKSLH